MKGARHSYVTYVAYCYRCNSVKNFLVTEFRQRVLRYALRKLFAALTTNRSTLMVKGRYPSRQGRRYRSKRPGFGPTGRARPASASSPS